MTASSTCASANRVTRASTSFVIKRWLLAVEPFPLECSVEYGSLIIHSLVTGVARAVYGNVKNTALIGNLPEGCCVEVPMLVNGTGLHPVRVDDLPPQRAAHRRPEPRRPGRARRRARARLPRGDARPPRPERTLPRRDSRDGGRTHRGPRRCDAGWDLGGRPTIPALTSYRSYLSANSPRTTAACGP